MRNQYAKQSKVEKPGYLEGAPMALYKREGEEGTVPFRSSRFFCVGNRWYFTTREGFDSGPYASRDRAHIGLKRFLHVVKLLPDEEAMH